MASEALGADLYRDLSELWIEALTAHPDPPTTSVKIGKNKAPIFADINKLERVSGIILAGAQEPRDDPRPGEVILTPSEAHAPTNLAPERSQLDDLFELGDPLRGDLDLKAPLALIAGGREPERMDLRWQREIEASVSTRDRGEGGPEGLNQDPPVLSLWSSSSE